MSASSSERKENEMKDRNMVQGELFKNWNGHEMTETQYAYCSAATEWLYDWDLTVPGGIEETYEKETARSCVYWGPAPTLNGNICGDPCRDYLPREENYITNGYTNEFVSWVNDRVYSAVCLNGIVKMPEIWDFVRKEA